MPIEGHLETHKLRFRTNLGTGEVEINGKKIPFQFSMNIDNKAIFIEFPGMVVYSYLTSEMVEDAIARYEEYLKLPGAITG